MIIKKRSDIFSKKRRSEIMSLVRSKNTKPELAIRSRLHKLGYRFRLHRRDLPGHPDLVLPKYKHAIFVHGCFWHQHPGCKKATIPQDNHEFWSLKLTQNIERDRKNIRLLRKSGWKVIVVWECEIKKDVDTVIESIATNLNASAEDS
jgi:DNA mismatch endonuclease, patch repair protein